jgi:hypothetical protein
MAEREGNSAPQVIIYCKSKVMNSISHKAIKTI